MYFYTIQIKAKRGAMIILWKMIFLHTKPMKNTTFQFTMTTFVRYQKCKNGLIMSTVIQITIMLMIKIGRRPSLFLLIR